jgi:hypothetical protein
MRGEHQGGSSTDSSPSPDHVSNRVDVNLEPHLLQLLPYVVRSCRFVFGGRGHLRDPDPFVDLVLEVLVEPPHGRLHPSVIDQLRIELAGGAPLSHGLCRLQGHGEHESHHGCTADPTATSTATRLKHRDS